MTDQARQGLALGVDVGGTHVRAALIDVDGKILNVVRRNLVKRDPQSLLQHIEDMRTELGYPPGSPIPMGIGLAAQLWIDTGMVAVAPNLGWENVPFGDMVRARFRQNVRLVNDLNAITVGESEFGAGSGADDMVCVFVGTGVGMGAVSHGRIIEGADGLATELGHVKVEAGPNARLCGCGEHGCLEAYTSGRHLPDLLAQKVLAGMDSPLFASAKDNKESLSAKSIEQAALGGDEAAAALWSDVGELLARAIGNAVTLFNPRVLVLGGGVLQSAPTLKRRVSERIRIFSARPAMRKLQLKDSVLADDAGVVGAATLARHSST